MNLSISNIAWQSDNDALVFDIMNKYGFTGLEIAPTRIFPENPYSMLKEARAWSEAINKAYGFVIPSMQSIWYGRTENIFASEKERRILIDYTKQAIDFAQVISCDNLVFGCPRNRNIPEQAYDNSAVAFFKEVGDYAASKGTVIGMEANPTIYNTNYINYTEEALELISKVQSEGFKLNLDIGTMITNNEQIEELIGSVGLINHVHISEPGLKMIEERPIHHQLKKLLSDENYQGFVSIEMGKVDEVAQIDAAARYIAEIFG